MRHIKTAGVMVSTTRHILFFAHFLPNVLSFTQTLLPQSYHSLVLNGGNFIRENAYVG